MEMTQKNRIRKTGSEKKDQIEQDQTEPVCRTGWTVPADEKGEQR